MTGGGPLHLVTGNGGATLPTVVVCLPGRQHGIGIADALRGRATVQFAATFPEVRQLVRERRGRGSDVAAVVVGVTDRDGRQAAPFVRELAAEEPDVSLVARCRAGIEHSAELRALAAAGVHEFMFEGIDDAGVALRAVLQAAARECAAEAVLRRLARLLPRRLLPFAECCLANPTTARTLPDVALMLGVHRKTLFNYCRQERLPAPAELLVWCRLLLVAHLLETTGRTVEAIALELEFPSGNALRNTVKRYAGTTATDLRRNGGLQAVLDAFEARRRAME